MQRSNDIKAISGCAGTSLFPLEKRNVVYTLCGKRSGSTANKKMQKMVVSVTDKTPADGAGGNTWVNPECGPPY